MKACPLLTDVCRQLGVVQHPNVSCAHRPSAPQQLCTALPWSSCAPQSHHISWFVAQVGDGDYHDTDRQADLPIFRYMWTDNTHFEPLSPVNRAKLRHCLPAAMELYTERELLAAPPAPEAGAF